MDPKHWVPVAVISCCMCRTMPCWPGAAERPSAWAPRHRGSTIQVRVTLQSCYPVERSLMLINSRVFSHLLTFEPVLRRWIFPRSNDGLTSKYSGSEQLFIGLRLSLTLNSDWQLNYHVIMIPIPNWLVSSSSCAVQLLDSDWLLKYHVTMIVISCWTASQQFILCIYSLY